MLVNLECLKNQFRFELIKETENIKFHFYHYALSCGNALIGFQICGTKILYTWTLMPTFKQFRFLKDT